MQSNKSTGTKPEILLGSAMWQIGLRYRKNSRHIFGNPDFSFKKHKIAVFVDGEFWHGKDWEKRKADIKTNRKFWIAKIERNIRRDREVDSHLTQTGWKVFRFWARDIVKNPQTFAEEIQKAVYEKPLSSNADKPESEQAER
jgi:putative nmeDIP very short patch repair endonuclease